MKVKKSSRLDQASTALSVMSSFVGNNCDCLKCKTSKNTKEVKILESIQDFYLCKGCNKKYDCCLNLLLYKFILSFICFISRPVHKLHYKYKSGHLCFGCEESMVDSNEENNDSDGITTADEHSSGSKGVITPPVRKKRGKIHKSTASINDSLDYTSSVSNCNSDVEGSSSSKKIRRVSFDISKNINISPPQQLSNTQSPIVSINMLATAPLSPFNNQVNDLGNDFKNNSNDNNYQSNQEPPKEKR